MTPIRRLPALILFLALIPPQLHAQAPPDHEQFTALLDLIIQDSLVDYRALIWYSEDFGGEAGLPGFFVPYLAGEERALLERGNVHVRFFEFDWTLNDVHAEHGEPGS